MLPEPACWPSARPILTAAAMRAAELACVDRGVSLAALMDRAGAALAELVWRVAAGRAVLILTGPGNNGGDGYVAARLLAERGAAVRVARAGDPRSDLAIAAAGRWTGPTEALTDTTAPAPILVDALFGTGLVRPLDGLLAAMLERLAVAAQRVIAVDLPSGVGTDDGALLGVARGADVTLALGALKPAHVLLPAAARCGRVELADIGIAASPSMTSIGVPLLPLLHAADHKYTRGLVAVVAGAMSGAAELAARAALRGGAGYVQLLGGKTPPTPPWAIVRRAMPEAFDARTGAIVIGPGLGQGEQAKARMAAALASGMPLVVDADALPLYDPASATAPAILTPHGGEFARLAGDTGGSKIDRTLAVASRLNAVVIHKGADTIVAAPDGRIAVGWPGNAWLASAGTGDVLAGLCGAMLARGLDPFAAACAAVALHGEAAHRAGPGLTADDLIAGSIWP